MTNLYDNPAFFEKYSQMLRSVKGLDGAGEWPALRGILPDFQGKRVLDLGCGFGWHCLYAAECGAEKVIGVDSSAKMLFKAKQQTRSNDVITYIHSALEEISFPAESFDIAVSSLVLHYIRSFEDICRKVNIWLAAGGDFIFSVEHPVFTAQGPQDWFYSETGEKLHWPVDNYFREGKREARFLGEQVEKYHKTLTTYLNTLIDTGFEIRRVIEPQPPEQFLKDIPDMAEELRRPMMLLVAARKKPNK